MPEVIISDYFYGDEAEMFQYFRIPKQLITDERFKGVSTDAKLLYGMLLDRMSLSVKNQWFDKDGRVYIYYTVEEICEDMTCGRDKAMKLLAELDKGKGIGLIERIRQGQGKPTKIYVKHFTTRDIPPISEVENSDVQKSDFPTSRSRDNRPQEVGKTDSNQTDNKRRWGKTGGVLGYHLIHSYAPGELTPEEAHGAGVEFARRLLGDRYEAVVSTHLDREHLHCHIVFNSVSFVDGAKYRNTFKDYFGDIRGLSNEVSEKHGLSVIDPEGGGRSYAEWSAESRGRPTLRGLVRQDIDAAIAGAYTAKSFWQELARMGYVVKRGPHVAHTAVRPPGGQRFLRLDSLGGGYTEVDILARLAQGRAEPPIVQTEQAKCPFLPSKANSRCWRPGTRSFWIWSWRTAPNMRTSRMSSAPPTRK